MAGSQLPAPPSEKVLRASSDRAVTKLVALLGGRDALVDTLEIGEGRPEINKVLDFLGDPRYERHSLPTLCRLAGVTVAEFFAAFRSAKLVEAQIQATVAIAQQLPAVVDDVMRRAAPHEIACEVCKGTGSIGTKPDAPPDPCQACRGTGAIPQLPDLDRQKLALELGDLVKKGGGISLTQNQVTLGGGVAPGALEALQSAVAGAMARGPLVLDVSPEPPA